MVSVNSEPILQFTLNNCAKDLVVTNYVNHLQYFPLLSLEAKNNMQDI